MCRATCARSESVIGRGGGGGGGGGGGRGGGGGGGGTGRGLLYGGTTGSHDMDTSPQ